MSVIAGIVVSFLGGMMTMWWIFYLSDLWDR